MIPTPFLADLLLRLALPQQHRETVAGDLAEEYRLHVQPDLGAMRAHGWYWNQTIRAVVRLNRSRMLALVHAVTAVLAGYAAMVVAVLLTVTGNAWLDLVSGCVIGALGGFVTASWPGGKTGSRRAPALGLLSIALGFVNLAMHYGQEPLWFQVALIVVVLPAVLAGAWLRRQWTHRRQIT